jgi:CheY-like chemotaxis protein
MLLLLAEDQPVIRLVMEYALEEGGYEIVAAANGTDALAALEEHHSRLSGFITDIRVGNGSNGWELAHRARELNPDISVVYITGDSFEDWSTNGVPNSVILQKPFAQAQLVTAISMLLNDQV